MPRLELIEGTSQKYWEGEARGSALVVRWGRLGTAGQSQTKAFSSPAAALAGLEKLVREKTNKGYVTAGSKKTAAPTKASTKTPTKPAKTEPTKTPTKPAKTEPTKTPTKPAKTKLSPPTTPATSAQAFEDTDESILVVPSAWQRRVHPRRGYPSAGGTKTKVDGAGAKIKLFDHYRLLQKKLVAGAAQSVADGPLMKKVDARITTAQPPSDPRVEGALGAIARFRADYSATPRGEAAIDYWVSEQGLPFAVDAALYSLAFGMGIKPKAEWESSPWFALSAIDNEKNAKSFDAPGFVSHANDARPMLLRLRRLLAESSDADYAAARDVAGKHRKKTAYLERVVATYLFPTERTWVEADIAEYKKEQGKIRDDSELRGWLPDHLRLLVASITRFDDFLQMNKVSDRTALPGAPHDLTVTPHDVVSPREMIANYTATLLEGMGKELLPLARYWCDTWVPHTDLALALAAIPADEAIDTLLDHANDKHGLAALTQAVAAFPQRAARLIGARVRAQGKNYKVVAPLMPSAASAGKARGAPASKTALATASDLPAALVTPPWVNATSTKKGPAAALITGIAMLSHPAALVWEAGEKERFALHDWDPAALEPGGYLEVLQKGKWAPPGPFTKWTEAQWNALTTDWEHHFKVVHAPENISFAAAKWWAEHPKYYCPLPLAVVRYEIRMLPLVVAQAKRYPDKAVEHLGPFDAAELAPIVASVGHIKKLKPATEGWLTRHPRATAVGLIPLAVSGSKEPNKAAVAALQVIVRAGHEGVVREVAAQYGDAVVAALGRVIGVDPRLAKQPKAPAFWAPAKLPPVTLKSGAALPPQALDNLRIMLALNELDRPFPRLAEVLAACDRGSLSALGWALFEAWQRAGSPNDEKWALVALGVLGDDEVARKLTPLIRKWPGESAHARATIGLDVLASIGTDLALSSIQGIAERLKFEALQELAKKHIAAIAKRRNLGVDELEDRLVPTLDLDPSGTTRLDYGGRTFTVGFDETLRPFVRDDAGKRLPDLPKPGAKDDAEIASRAHATFMALKKDVRAIGPNQIHRLERAMVAGRRWSAADFDAFLVRHPLVGHLVRSLVWGAYAGEKLVATFRVAEDGTLASIDDSVFALNESHAVSIVHPLALDEKTLARWGNVFSEYEMLQPFAQLGRGRYSKSEVEKVVKGVKGTRLATGKVLSLTNLGWKRGAPQDSGHVGSMTRDTTIGVLHLELEEGFIAGALAEAPEQTLGALILGGSKVLDAKLLRGLGDIEASELAHSLATLTP